MSNAYENIHDIIIENLTDEDLASELVMRGCEVVKGIICEGKEFIVIIKEMKQHEKTK
jgi:hypothetical protein